MFIIRLTIYYAQKKLKVFENFNAKNNDIIIDLINELEYTTKICK